MPPSSTRQPDLDWLRVIAIVAVLVQHAANPYAAHTGVVSNAEVSPLVRTLTLVFAGWRMPLMLALAGMALVLALGDRDGAAYLRLRLRRLGLPLAVGLVVLVPPQRLAITLAAGTGEGIRWAAVGPIHADGTVVWAHLWFLAHLLVATGVGLPLAVALRTHRARLTAWPGSRPWLLAGLVLLPLAAQGVRTSWTQDLWISRVLDGRAVAGSTAYVLVGVLLAGVPGLREAAGRARRLTVSLALGCLAARVTLLDAPWAWAGYAHAVVTALEGFAWILGLSGYAQRYLTHDSAALRRVAGSTYAFYLLHQPVLLGLAVVILPWSLPIGIEMVLLGLATLVCTVTLCEAARTTSVTRLAFGFPERRTVPREAPVAVPAPQAGRADAA